jgi:cell division protein FtsL
MDKLLALTIIILCISAYFNTEWIAGVNRQNEQQQQSIDSLKVEICKIDSTLKAWDKEYQENLDMSNDLVKELEKYENN